MAELSLEQIQKILEDIKALMLRVEIAETRLKERDKIVYDLLHPDLQALIDDGDMAKSVYDTGDNGVVDNSEKLEGSTKTQVQDHTPKGHALDVHGAPSDNIPMNSKKFTGLVDPADDQDSATKKYHDDNLLFPFGDGSDGVVVISSNTTLTTDKYYINLTINNGVVLYTGGYKIYGTGTLLNNGSILNDGLNATSKVGAVGAPGNTVRGGTAGGTGDEQSPTGSNFGGGGGSGAGTVFISFKIIDNSSGVIRARGGDGHVGSYNQCNSNHNGGAGTALSVGNGGNGGAGGTAGGTGGAAGVVTVTKQTFNGYVSGMNVFDYVLNEGIGGGTGGGAGGLGCNEVGRGGGGGGGHVLIYYNSASWSTETATGGDGGNNGSSGTVNKIEIS